MSLSLYGGIFAHSGLSSAEVFIPHQMFRVEKEMEIFLWYQYLWTREYDVDCCVVI